MKSKSKSYLCRVMRLTILLCFILNCTGVVYAVPAKPVLAGDPIHGQILPYYGVTLRWIDS